METVPSGLEAYYLRDFRDAAQATEHGIVAATADQGRKYWNHWVEYVKPLQGIDPYLQPQLTPTQIQIVQGFIARVRRGDYGNGQVVKADTSRIAIRAIASKIQLAGKKV